MVPLKFTIEASARLGWYDNVHVFRRGFMEFIRECVCTKDDKGLDKKLKSPARTPRCPQTRQSLAFRLNATGLLKRGIFLDLVLYQHSQFPLGFKSIWGHPFGWKAAGR
eukprot:gene2258-biopygen6465